MCNGHSTRISQGGSIAVLRSRSRDTSPALETPEEWRLYFFNNNITTATRPETGTRVELQSSQTYNGDCRIFIHHDGDLNATAATLPPNHIPANPFYAFSLKENSESVVRLAQRLDLGVGGAGIIGRRVSLVARGVDGEVNIAEGVIGWN
ncbi:hypothetical protein B0J11DRAFT_72792 [Dendryphion nanum]|uniref:Uncharacterized protein n=1 Tax=Dendryphion nanum TaxID=256645 RepID=A0A9P9DIP4_9PLEO|nr:hypothetical protein B0J11DRAFT_72792 [Dendryphion nanum]